MTMQPNAALLQLCSVRLAQQVWVPPRQHAELVHLARYHGVAGIVRARLAELGVSLGAEVSAALELSAQRALFCELRVRREFALAADILHGAGCSAAVPIKGVQLLATLYERPGARSVTDVDLLIAASERDLAHHALVREGYVHVPKPPGRPASQLAHYERSYLSPGGVVVDVHTALCQKERAALDYSAMLARALSAPARHPWCAASPMLDAEDTLLVLCIHMAQDCYAGPLRQLVDVAWWIDRKRPDLSVVFERAGEAGATTVVWAALDQARRRLGAPVPPSILAEQRPSGLRGLWFDSLFSLGGASPYPFRHAKRLAQALTLLPSLDTGAQRRALLEGYAVLRLKDSLSPFMSSPSAQPVPSKGTSGDPSVASRGASAKPATVVSKRPRG